MQVHGYLNFACAKKGLKLAGTEVTTLDKELRKGSSKNL